MLQATAPTTEREADGGTRELAANNNDQSQARNVNSIAESAGQYDRQSSTVHTSVAFACLYTKHKTQKRKVWHDGRLLLYSSRAVLFEANTMPGSEGSPLGECDLTASHRNAILQKQETCIELENFLVEIQGLWNAQAKKIGSSLLPLRSKGMEKILTNRFQKPGLFVPPDPSKQQQQDQSSVLGKRRRPLQPGEWHQRFYGKQASAPAAVLPPAWNQVSPAWSQVPAPAWNKVNEPRPNVNSTSQRSQSSQRTSPFVPSSQMHDTEQWSPRRSLNDSSIQNDAVNHRPVSIGEHRTVTARDMMQGGRDMGENRSRHQTERTDSELSGGPHHVGASTTQRQNNHFLDKNGFDPTSFYGEDEEVEEDKEDDSQSEDEAPWFSVNPSAMEKQDRLRDPKMSAAVPAGSNQRREEPSSSLESTLEPTQCEKGGSAVLSRNELLQLFAIGSPPSPKSIPKETATDEKPQDEPLFELMLPSASESSSDEE